MRAISNSKTTLSVFSDFFFVVFVAYVAAYFLSFAMCNGLFALTILVHMHVERERFFGAGRAQSGFEFMRLTCT